jgi:formylglycine-generating enzyme required for sulfatase activity
LFAIARTRIALKWSLAAGYLIVQNHVSRVPATAEFQPNRYGAYHLSGNVVEWTLTAARPYNRERPYADDDGRNRDDLTEARVVRGGS